MGRISGVVLAIVLCGLVCFVGQTLVNAEEVEKKEGIYQGVSTAVQFDISPPLREMASLEFDFNRPLRDTNRDSGFEGPLGPQTPDAAIQNFKGQNKIPAPSGGFPTIGNIAGYSPPDPNGDIGPNHYVVMSNVHFGIFDRTGTLLYGPVTNNTLWSGFGGPCETENAGDPIVLYDQLADRWLLTQFTASSAPYYNCVALSQTGDPTGSYYRWAFITGTTGDNFPDYPKYGIWPDAYYISTREFYGTPGQGAYALERDEMILGNPSPQVISFLVTPGSTPYIGGDGLLPCDLDGDDLPPAGSPQYYIGSMDDGGSYGAPQDALYLFEFDVDFVTPSNSSFVQTATIPVAAFDSMYPCGSGRSCIPQPGTATLVDILSYRQRPMFRLAYRNYGTHESLVTNQSVETPGPTAGVRWYELRDPGGTPTIYQQGTYAPGDGIHRWMGSAAMDQVGNLAVGYSASNATTVYPSSYYTGRLAGDPLGTLPQGEGIFAAGSGSQTGSSRWGDYTSLNVDPVDDCTFWYTNQYYTTTSSVGWELHVGAFVFQDCLCEMPGVLSGLTATPAGDNQIQLNWSQGFPLSVTFNVYRAIGTCPQSAYVQIASGLSSLSYLDTTASGGVTYAYVVTGVDISGNCETDDSNCSEASTTGTCTEPPTFDGIQSVTDPGNGICTLDLAWNAGAVHCGGPIVYNVYRSTTPGFTPGAGNLLAAGLTSLVFSDMNSILSGTPYYYIVRAEDQTIGIDDGNLVELSGIAYGPGGGPTTWLTEDFEGTFPPTGWTVYDNIGGDVWDRNDTLGHPNQTSGTGFSAATGLNGSSGTAWDTELWSPSIDLVMAGVVTLTYASNFQDYAGNGDIWLDITTDGGGSWINLRNQTADDPAGGTAENEDLSAYSGETITLRWRYAATTSTSWYWHNDDVLLDGTVLNPCTPGSGCADNPFVDVTPDGPMLFCTGTAQLLSAGLTGGTGPFTYQWTEDGLDIAFATNSTHTVNSTGTHSYNCKVSAAACTDDVYDPSTTDITWQIEPVFAGITSATNAGLATCTIDLAWDAASTPCAGPITYSIYRDTTTPVSTIPANRIAIGVVGLTYSDSSSLVSGTTYYYVVHAVDQSTSGEDANAVEASAAPYGPGGGTQTVFFDDFESDLGWVFAGAGEWERGAPGALGGTYGTPDPASAYSGSIVIGNDLSGAGTYLGDYENSVVLSTAVSPAIDCTGVTSVQLDLQRWLGSETSTYDEAVIAVSNDGSAWSQVWMNGGSSADTSWQPMTYDISTVADNQATVYIRFSIDTDGSVTYCGWNIDDVEVSGWIDQPCIPGSCNAPSSLSNNSATDLNGCADDGIEITWSADPGDWGDSGVGTRTYDVLRDGSPIQSGITYGTTTYVDTTGVNGTTYNYQVMYNNGCGMNSTTTGDPVADSINPSTPSISSITDNDPLVQDGIFINYSGGSPATQHDLYDESGLLVLNYISGTLYDPGDTLSHDYYVRAVYGGCTTNSTTYAFADAEAAGGAAVTVANGTEVGTTPLGAIKNGADMDVTWDSTTANCMSAGYHLIYGMGANITAYTVSGSDCTLTTLGTHLWTTAPDTTADWCWFLVVGNDGVTTEGGWGADSIGTPRSAAASGECGTTAIDNTLCIP